jgi:hypothetical protein
LRVNTAVAGMTFSLSPAWKLPTVTTADSSGGTSRATMLWIRTTTWQARTTGSMVSSGREP